MGAATRAITNAATSPAIGRLENAAPWCPLPSTPDYSCEYFSAIHTVTTARLRPGVWIFELRASGAAFLTAEAPDILQLAAKALRAAPLPTTVEGWGRLGRAEDRPGGGRLGRRLGSAGGSARPGGSAGRVRGARRQNHHHAS